MLSFSEAFCLKLSRILTEEGGEIHVGDYMKVMSDWAATNNTSGKSQET